jgi:small subunit ribosomal protein S24e
MKLDIQVIDEKSNLALNRREIVFKVIHDEATPSRKSIVERLAATQNSKIGLVYVDSMKTEFGKRETIGYAKIYETAERAKQIERAHIIERNTFAKPKEAKPEEATPEAS